MGELINLIEINAGKDLQYSLQRRLDWRPGRPLASFRAIAAAHRLAGPFAWELGGFNRRARPGSSARAGGGRSGTRLATFAST